MDSLKRDWKKMHKAPRTNLANKRTKNLLSDEKKNVNGFTIVDIMIGPKNVLGTTPGNS
jgi:hypothetical protein